MRIGAGAGIASRRVALAAAVALVATAALVGGLTESAAACSCGTGTAYQEVSTASVAFIGRVVETRDEPDERVFRVEVLERVKGEVPGVVEMIDSKAPPLCPSPSIPVDAAFGWIRRPDDPDIGTPDRMTVYGCTQVFDPDGLRAAARPLPELAGSGPPRFVAAGVFRTPALLTLDGQGHPLRFISLSAGETTRTFAKLGACPDGQHIAVWAEGSVMIVDVVNGRVIDRSPARLESAYGGEIWCLDAARAEVVLFAPPGSISEDASVVAVNSRTESTRVSNVEDLVQLDAGPPARGLTRDGALVDIDLAAGTVTELWRPPPGQWVAGMDTAPGGADVVIATRSDEPEPA